MGKMQVGMDVGVAGELELIGKMIMRIPAEEINGFAEHLCETLIMEVRPIVDATEAENDADFLLILLNQQKRWVKFAMITKLASQGHILLDLNLFVDMFKSKWMETMVEEDTESNNELLAVLEAMKVSTGLADKLVSGLFA